MNTETLIDQIAEKTGQSKPQTEATVNEALKIIRGTVASGRAVRLPDFGTFESRYIPGIDIKVVKFLPAESFREEVNDS
jgi:nucleoid DNA-binding protein